MFSRMNTVTLSLQETQLIVFVASDKKIELSGKMQNCWKCVTTVVSLRASQYFKDEIE